MLRLRFALAILLVATGISAGSVSPPAAAEGPPITGSLFLDTNFDGIQDPLETDPVDTSGLNLVAQDSAGNTAAAVFTGNDYTINVSALAGTKFRLRFTADPTSLVYPGAASLAGGQTGIDYVDAGASVQFAVTSGPKQVCSDNPVLTTTCWRPGALSDPLVSSYKGLNSLNWESTSPADANETTVATTGQVGTLWGLGYDGINDRLFASAALRRYSSLNPDSDPGAIYVVSDYTGARTLSKFMSLANVGTAPTNAQRQLGPSSAPGPDPLTFPLIGKVGIGDVDVNSTGTLLYASNLNTRDIVRVDSATKTQTPLGLPAATSTLCNGTGIARPWALKVKGQAVYAGVTCDASISGNGSDLTAQVYRFQAGEWTPTFATPIDLSYARGCAAIRPVIGCQPWFPWTDDPQVQVDNGEGANFGGPEGWAFTYSQPILADLEFTNSGALALGFVDRGMMQWGNFAPFPQEGGGRSNGAGGVYSLYAYMPHGDILAASTQDGMFTLENNGQVGGLTSATGVGNGEGPGGGEFYAGDNIRTPLFGHTELSMAGMAVKPGTDLVAMTSVDPEVFTSSGVSWMSSVDGSKTRGYTTMVGTTSDFGKAGSMGDLEIICRASGTVQVGNYVWFDANGDGIQDVDEKPIPGVAVNVYAASDVGANGVPNPGATPIGTATTNAQGEWLVDGLAPNTEYVAIFNASNADLTGITKAGVPITAAELNLSPTASGDDQLIDSNIAGTRTAGVARFTTGAMETVRHDIDAGYTAAPRVAVGDYVFIDGNGDGLQDAEDRPVPGATMTLTGPDGQPVTDIAGNVVGPVTTDADGKYLFTNLPPLPAGQSYTVSIDPSTAPSLAGLVPTQPGVGDDRGRDSSSGSAASAADLSVDGALDNTLDFGFVPPSVSVGDYVFIDTNGDGVQDASDTPVSGATMTLTGPDGQPVTDVFGNPVAPVTTGADGSYAFANLPTLPAGQSYTVSIDPSTAPSLAGYVPTQTGAGTPATDSSTGSAATTADLSTSGASDTTLDFGFVPASVSLGDYVFIDTNGDGVQDASDTPVPGATMTLTGPDGQPVTDVFGNPVAPITTGADGTYAFSNLPTLPAGQSYTVSIDPSTAPALAGYVPTQTGAGTPTTDSSTGSAATTADLSTNGSSDTSLDFGFVPSRVAVGDYVFIDRNGDGLQDASDTPVEGATMTLTGPDGQPVTDIFGNPVAPVTTGADGKYNFANLPALPAGQSYTVSIDPSTAPALAGFVPATAGAGDDPTKDSSTGAASTTANLSTDGSSDTSLDFGFVPGSVTVGDYVFIDSNGDGLQDASDVAVPGATMTLTGPDGQPVTNVFGTPVAPVTTDADGRYSFANLPTLPAGQAYTVSIDPTTAPTLAGYVPTSAGTGGNPAVDSSTGSAATTTNLSTAGASDTTLDFGFVPARVSVGDYVFIDSNGDGLQDAGDKPVSGATMTLTGPDGQPVTDIFGNPVTPVTTNAEGKYTFANLPTLPAGQSYTVTVDPSTAPALAGFVPTTAGAGTDRGADSSTGSATTTTDLSAEGAADLSLDFGFVPPAVSIGDYVFIDTNRDGLQDAGDKPVSGATMTVTGPDGQPVTDIFGNPVAAVTTNAEGKYTFANLPTLPVGQSYTVTVDPSTAPALAGFVPTTAGAGTDSGLDSSTGSASTSANLTTDGATDTTLDFGFVPQSVSVGDFVFIDTNGDGVQNEGDQPVAGATLRLTGPDGQPVTDAFGNPVAPVTTGADGKYTFTELPLLPAGQSYTVTIDPSTAPALAGLIPTAAGVGDDRGADSSTGSAISTANLSTDKATDTGLDFGFYQPVSIGDKVFYDVDRDGVQSTDDPPVPGVTVNLLDAQGNPVLDVDGTPVTTTTDAEGFYSFTNLVAGQAYIVEFVRPDGSYFTTQTVAGSAPGTDSDADVETGRASVTAPNDGENNAERPDDPTVDAGLLSFDLTVEKVLTTTEPVPAGGNVTFTLTPHNNGPVNALAGWSVTDLLPAGLTLVSMSGAGYTCAGTTCTASAPLAAGADGPAITVVATYDGTPGLRNIAYITPDPDDIVESNVLEVPRPGDDTDKTTTNNDDSVLITPAKGVSVGDKVFIDSNRNGIQDSGDKPLTGVRLTLTGPDGQPVTDIFGKPVGVATTDANGNYVFDNLPVLEAGQSYTVTLDPASLPAGLRPTTPGVGGDRGTDSSTGRASSTGLTTDGSSDLSLDFGFVEVPSDPPAAPGEPPAAPGAPPAVGPTPGSPPAGLAFTGADTLRLLGAMMLLLVSGAGLYWIGRRRNEGPDAA